MKEDVIIWEKPCPICYGQRMTYVVNEGLWYRRSCEHCIGTGYTLEIERKPVTKTYDEAESEEA